VRGTAYPRICGAACRTTKALRVLASIRPPATTLMLTNPVPNRCRGITVHAFHGS
jgi:hypothetical protein